MMKGTGGNYRNLIMWQKADRLAKKVYRVTYNFPKTETYGIASQLRRAALSVPTNIVEGYARRSDKELRNFLNIAYGSLVEVEYLLGFSKDLNFLTSDFYDEIKALHIETGALIWSFMKKININ